MVRYQLNFSQYKGFFLIELMVTLCVLTIGLSGTYQLLAQSAVYAASAQELNRSLDNMLNSLEHLRVHKRPNCTPGMSYHATSKTINSRVFMCHTMRTEHRGPLKQHTLNLTMGT